MRKRERQIENEYLQNVMTYDAMGCNPMRCELKRRISKQRKNKIIKIMIKIKTKDRKTILLNNSLNFDFFQWQIL